MTVEQFNELISILNELHSSFVAFFVLCFVLVFVFIISKCFISFLKQSSKNEDLNTKLNNVKLYFNKVKRLSHTNNRESYDYCVDCLISSLDDLYND